MEYENILIQGRNYLRVSEKFNAPSYMVGVLQKYRFREFVEFRIIDKDEGEYLLYETDAFIGLAKYLSENGLDTKTFRTITEKINLAFNTCNEYLLDAGRMVFVPEFVFLRPGTTEIRFIYSLTETCDIRKSVRKFLSMILGNYFQGLSVDDETLREWALREINGKDFSISRLLSMWHESRRSIDGGTIVEVPETEKPDFMSSMRCMWGKIKTMPNDHADDETIPVNGNGGGIFLNGLCSIDTKIPIPEDGVTIGRQMLKQKYGLVNGRIGKVHARIYLVGEEAYVTDMGSRNGTFLNGERLKKQKAERIMRGDIVSFSDEEFILC